MKIIRVTGCHDCPYPYIRRNNGGYYCDVLIDVVSGYRKDKTLPDNCPLEDVVQIITKLEVEGKFGSAK